MRSKLAGLGSSPFPDLAMTKEDEPASGALSSTFKTTLIRVLVVQVVALALLALLQIRYPG